MNEPCAFQVGDFTCHSVSDGFIQMPSRRLVPHLSDAEFAVARERYKLPPDKMQLSFTAVLIDTGSHRVLVDTGMGPDGHPTSGRLPAGLRAAGIGPEDIDVIVITHGHIDHVGGLVDAGGVPAFPDATVMLSAAEWDFWAPTTEGKEQTDFAARSRAGLALVQDRVRRLEPEAVVVPGIIVHDGAGHTPGHLVVEVVSEGKRLWLLGDLVFHPIHVENPEWPAAADHDKDASIKARQAWLPRLGKGSDLAHAFHMPFPAVGRVRARPDGWKWEPQTS